MNRWRCLVCDRTLWSPDSGDLVDRAKSHLTDHYRDDLEVGPKEVSWTCPHCEYDKWGTDRRSIAAAIKEHLFAHHRGTLESDTHVAAEVDGGGNVLLSTRAGSGSGPCLHLLTPFSIPNTAVLMVTADPIEGVARWYERVGAWPAAFSIVTTAPFDPDHETLRGIDVGEAVDTTVLEVTDLGDLGSAITRELGALEGSGTHIVACFDVLPTLVEEFSLKRVFQFVHLLAGRMETADVFAHYHVSSRDIPASTVNMIDGDFDLAVDATGDVMRSDRAE